MARIIVLNGTSSSGKTALARAFQDAAGALFLNFSIDSILYTVPPHILDAMQQGRAVPGFTWRQLVPLFFACVRTMADRGFDLVVDHAVTTREDAEALVEQLEDHRVLLVRVHCHPELLAERERTRGDRAGGLSHAQLESIDRWLEYDVNISTDGRSPSESAAGLLMAMETANWSGLRRTRARLEHGDS